MTCLNYSPPVLRELIDTFSLEDLLLDEPPRV